MPQQVTSTSCLAVAPSGMLQVYGYVFWTVAVRRAMNGTMVTVLMSRLKSRSTSNTGTVMYVAVSCI